MHATQPQGGTSPEPHGAEPESYFVGLLTDDTRFRTWLAQAPLTAAQPPTAQDKTDPDGYTLTETGLQVLDEATTAQAPGTAAQVLRDAALYLERHGWITGAYYDSTTGSFTPPACMVGAIGMVCYGGPVDAPAQHFDDPGFLDFEEAVLHLDRYLLAVIGLESYEFNDANGRRVEDVTRVLRNAAGWPADALIEALRAIDAENADVAARAELLVPGGVERCSLCGSSEHAVRLSIREVGNLVEYCGDDWHGEPVDGPSTFDWSEVVDADGYPIPGRAVVSGSGSYADAVDADGDTTSGGAA